MLYTEKIITQSMKGNVEIWDRKRVNKSMMPPRCNDTLGAGNNSTSHKNIEKDYGELLQEFREPLKLRF